MPNDCNMATEAVPNEIPNDCDMATQLVPNEIEYDHRTYWISYRMASREKTTITTKRWSPRSHSDGYHYWTTHMEIERISGSLTVPSDWPRRLPNGVPKDQETIAERHTELNANPPYRRPTKWLPRSKRIFYRSCLPRWPQRSQARTHQSYHPNDFHREAFHRDPTECRIKRWRDLQMQYMDQLCHPRVVTASAICESQSQCLERKLTALSEVKTGSTWWSTNAPTFTLANSDDGLCLEST